MCMYVMYVCYVYMLCGYYLSIILWYCYQDWSDNDRQHWYMELCRRDSPGRCYQIYQYCGESRYDFIHWSHSLCESRNRDLFPLLVAFLRGSGSFSCQMVILALVLMFNCQPQWCLIWLPSAYQLIAGAKQWWTRWNRFLHLVNQPLSRCNNPDWLV